MLTIYDSKPLCLYRHHGHRHLDRPSHGMMQRLCTMCDVLLYRWSYRYFLQLQRSTLMQHLPAQRLCCTSLHSEINMHKRHLIESTQQAAQGGCAAVRHPLLDRRRHRFQGPALSGYRTAWSGHGLFTSSLRTFSLSLLSTP